MSRSPIFTTVVMVMILVGSGMCHAEEKSGKKTTGTAAHWNVADVPLNVEPGAGLDTAGDAPDKFTIAIRLCGNVPCKPTASGFPSPFKSTARRPFCPNPVIKTISV